MICLYKQIFILTLSLCLFYTYLTMPIPKIVESYNII